jgi:hypothetical protein
MRRRSASVRAAAAWGRSSSRTAFQSTPPSSGSQWVSAISDQARSKVARFSASRSAGVSTAVDSGLAAGDGEDAAARLSSCGGDWAFTGAGDAAAQARERDGATAPGQADPVGHLRDRADGRVLLLVLRHEQHALLVADVDGQGDVHVREDDEVFQRDEQQLAQAISTPLVVPREE